MEVYDKKSPLCICVFVREWLPRMGKVFKIQINSQITSFHAYNYQVVSPLILVPRHDKPSIVFKMWGRWGISKHIQPSIFIYISKGVYQLKMLIQRFQDILTIKTESNFFSKAIFLCCTKRWILLNFYFNSIILHTLFNYLFHLGLFITVWMMWSQCGQHVSAQSPPTIFFCYNCKLFMAQHYAASSGVKSFVNGTEWVAACIPSHITSQPCFLKSEIILHLLKYFLHPAATKVNKHCTDLHLNLTIIHHKVIKTG